MSIVAMTRRLGVLERMTHDQSGRRLNPAEAKTKASGWVAVILAWRFLDWRPSVDLARTLRSHGAELTPDWMTTYGYSLVTDDAEARGVTRYQRLAGLWRHLVDQVGHAAAVDAVAEMQALLMDGARP